MSVKGVHRSSPLVEASLECKIVSTKCLNVWNKAVIYWMTPSQCPLINPAQKPHGFLWRQQPTAAYAHSSNLQLTLQRNSVFNDQCSVHTQSFILHFTHTTSVFVMYNVKCVMWKPQKLGCHLTMVYLSRYKPQDWADLPLLGWKAEIKAALN